MSDFNVPYLCGGLFLAALGQAKKEGRGPGSVTNEALFRGLIRQFYPDFHPQNRGDAFKIQVSNYKACRISKSMYLPFDQNECIEKYDQLIRSDYQRALGNMDNFILSSLRIDLGNAMQNLTFILLDLIKRDSSIDNDEIFYALGNGNPITKADLIQQDQYYISSLLLGIWHFILIHRPDNTKGRSTFEAWLEPTSGKGTEWKFIRSVGEDYQNKNITINVPSNKGSTSEGRTNKMINPTNENPKNASSNYNAKTDHTDSNNPNVRKNENNNDKNQYFINVSDGPQIANFYGNFYTNH